MTKICSVCYQKDAVQTHHLSYEPQLIIDVCLDCHEKIHKHGVGRGIRVATQDEVVKSYFTYAKQHEGKFTVFDAITNEILSWLICVCGRHDWHLYGNSQGKMYLRCMNCGQDFKMQMNVGCS